MPWSNKMNKWKLFLTTSGPAKEKTHKDSLISRSEAEDSGRAIALQPSPIAGMI